MSLMLKKAIILIKKRFSNEESLYKFQKKLLILIFGLNLKD